MEKILESPSSLVEIWLSNDDPTQLDLKTFKCLYDNQNVVKIHFENNLEKTQNKIKKLSNSIGFNVSV